MTKILKLASALTLAGAVAASSLNAADEFKFLPIFLDDTYKAHAEVALVGGYIDIDSKGADDGADYGIELSFDCPVFTLPGDNLLRQQLTVTRHDESDFSMTTIEMNPYYFIGLTDDLILGFGPGIGGMFAEVDNGKDNWLFTYQVGGGLKYYMGNLLVGADVRWQWTTEKDFGSGEKEALDNMRVLAKIGYRF